MKAQALADFIAECSIPFPENRQPESAAAAWMLYVDGSATSGGSGAGLVVVSPERQVHEHALKFLFKTLNNKAEYEASPVGMDLCYAVGVEHLCTFFGSQLMVSQVTGEYEPRDAAMVASLAKVQARSLSFKTFEIKHVPRSENRQVNALSKLDSSSPNGHLKSIRWEILHQPTITPRIVP